MYDGEIIVGVGILTILECFNETAMYLAGFARNF